MLRKVEPAVKRTQGRLAEVSLSSFFDLRYVSLKYQNLKMIIIQVFSRLTMLWLRRVSIRIPQSTVA
jgi:hypothetical protein